MTKTQKLICEIADEAKARNENPITAVQEYFYEKDSYFPRKRVAIILAAARDEQRKEARKVLEYCACRLPGLSANTPSICPTCDKPHRIEADKAKARKIAT